MGGVSPLPKTRWQWVRYNFVQLFRWYRVLGITTLSLLAYFLAFHVFENADVTGFLPPRVIMRFHWPDLPYFFVSKQTAPDGKSQETVFTVPTRQLTAKEMAQLQATNAAPKPQTAK